MRISRQQAQRLLVQLLSIGIVVTPLRAADPILGTWKLDVGKSRFALPAPKEQTEVYRELASGHIEFTMTRVQPGGASTTTKLSWPATGGMVKDLDGHLPKDVAIVETLLGKGDWLVTYLRC